MTSAGQLAAERRHLGVHGVGDRHRVGLRLAHHAERDRGLAVEAHEVAVVLGADLDAGDVAEPDHLAVALGDHQRRELLGRGHLAEGPYGELAPCALHPAGRQVDVLAPERGLDVGDRQVGGGQPHVVDPHAHRVPALARDDDGGDAAELAQAILDASLGDGGELELAVALARKRHPHDRARVGVALRDHRILHLVGERAAHPRDPVTHVVRGLVDVPPELELDRDLGDLLAAVRGQVTDAVDADQLVLERLGDRGLDHLGCGAEVDGGDGDDRGIDVGELAIGEPRQRDRAGQHDHQRHDRREDGALDRVVGDPQEAASGLAAGEGPAGTGSTTTPGASLLVPATTTTSPALRPERTSTRPS